MRGTTIAATAAAFAMALPATAAAHVTLNPRTAEPGAFTVLTVRVPNERDHKGTVKVDLRLPDGFYFLSYKKVHGWKTKLTRSRLDTPVDLEGFSVDQQFTRVVWKGNRKKGGIIRPDQFEEFPISVRVPDGTPGDALVFKAIQTYRGGEKVRWTGAPDSETPAPRVTLTAPAAATHALMGDGAEALLGA
jgi:uncharacterized protein YcnI